MSTKLFVQTERQIGLNARLLQTGIFFQISVLSRLIRLGIFKCSQTGSDWALRQIVRLGPPDWRQIDFNYPDWLRRVFEKLVAASLFYFRWVLMMDKALPCWQADVDLVGALSSPNNM